MAWPMVSKNRVSRPSSIAGWLSEVWREGWFSMVDHASGNSITPLVTRLHLATPHAALLQWSEARCPWNHEMPLGESRKQKIRSNSLPMKQCLTLNQSPFLDLIRKEKLTPNHIIAYKKHQKNTTSNLSQVEPSFASWAKLQWRPHTWEKVSHFLHFLGRRISPVMLHSLPAAC